MKWKALTRVIIWPVIWVGCQEKWELKGNVCLKSRWVNKMESFDIPAPTFISPNCMLSRLKSMLLKQINPHNLTITQYWPGHITDFMWDGEYTSWKFFLLLWGWLVVGEVKINIVETGGERCCREQQSHWNVELTDMMDGHLSHCHNQIGQKMEISVFTKLCKLLYYYIWFNHSLCISHSRRVSSSAVICCQLIDARLYLSWPAFSSFGHLMPKHVRPIPRAGPTGNTGVYPPANNATQDV